MQGKALDRRFLHALVRTLDAVVERPNYFPDVHEGMRRAMLNKFPYGVFFRIQADVIRVLGIIHLHRDPKYWQRRA